MEELTKIENKYTIESIYLPEKADVAEIVKDCNCAIVTYSLTDRGEICYPHKRFATRKMVVFFGNGFCHETVHAGIADIMIRHSQVVSKSHLYRFKNGFWNKTKWFFNALMYRVIEGFVPDKGTVDYRKRSNDQSWRV